MSKYQSQQEKVLNHMKQYGSITSVEAFKRYYICNLQSAIYSLRRKGYKILAVPYTDENKESVGRKYTIYSLVKENNNDKSWTL